MRRHILLLAALLILLPLLSACGGAEYEKVPNGEVFIHFLDVGQADCTLIRTQDAVILVDTGDVDPAVTKRIVRYLRRAGIDTIDCLVLTHPHDDHIGGAPTIFSEFTVKNCLMPLSSTETPLFSSVLDAITAEGCLLTEAVRDTCLRLGGLTINVLSPGPYDAVTDLNEKSAVLRIVWGESALLLPGDATAAIEEELVRRYGADGLRAGILKLSHHGAASSSIPEFLAAVAPTYAVASCGRGNSYGYPAASLVSSLSAAGIAFGRTDADGTLVFRGDGHGFSVIK